MSICFFVLGERDAAPPVLLLLLPLLLLRLDLLVLLRRRVPDREEEVELFLEDFLGMLQVDQHDI